MRMVVLTLVGGLILSSLGEAQSPAEIKLPAPDTTGGKPLMAVLKARQSVREFSPDSLPLPVLSNLLWAADGINRSESGKRTAPSAMNWQEIDVYVALGHGAYLYDAKNHALVPVVEGDIRAQTGMQPFVGEAALNLVYVADYAKISRAPDSLLPVYTTADAAFIAENVYLFCASEGLGVVVRASVDGVALAKTLKLRPEQHVVLAQTVGYPKK
jgi:SagB-type dehydrogenase family enzyme